jgi:drug/metabolite transporter (DMT)-like permease
MRERILSVEESTRRMEAIGLMCGSVACFAVLDSAVKYLAVVKQVPIGQIVWVRFCEHALLSVALLGPATIAHSWKSARPGAQVLRSLFMFATTAFNFSALQYLQLDQTATFTFLAPFLIAVLSGPILGEWLGWRRLIVVSIGFSGVLLVIRPDAGHGVHWAFLLSAGATACVSFYNIWTRLLARYDPPNVTQFYSPLAGVLLAAPFGLYFWQWPADVLTALLLVSLGVSGGMGHWLLIRAHHYAPAPILAPFIYVGLLYMTVIEYAVFGEVPNLWTLGGGAVIISSGLYLLYHERARMRR